jgi:hypothetical protein
MSAFGGGAYPPGRTAVLAREEGGPGPPDGHQPRAPWSAVVMAVLPTVLFVALLWLHVPRANGPGFWAWPWVSLDPLRSVLPFAVPLLLLLAALVWIDLVRVRTVLILFFLATFSAEAAGVLADPRGPSMVPQIIESAAATGYYTEALDSVRGDGILPLLRHYDKVDMTLHAQTHPPGPILYFHGLIRLFGPLAAREVGGWGIGLLAALSAPLFYGFAGVWNRQRAARLKAAALFSIVPGLVLFFPEFDQVDVLFTLALVTLWARALRQGEGPARPGSWRTAAALGTVLFVQSLFAYHVLSVGLFLVGLAVLSVKRAGDRRTAVWRVVAAGGIAAAVFLLGHLAFASLTGYRPVPAFLRGLRSAAAIRQELARPGGLYRFWDLYGLLLAAGMLPIGLLLLYRRAVRRQGAGRQAITGLAPTLMGLSIPVFLSLAGWMHGENARIWLYLQPFLYAPAAEILGPFSRRQLALLLLVEWGALVTLKSNLLFIGS